MRAPFLTKLFEDLKEPDCPRAGGVPSSHCSADSSGVATEAECGCASARSSKGVEALRSSACARSTAQSAACCACAAACVAVAAAACASAAAFAANLAAAHASVTPSASTHAMSMACLWATEDAAKASAPAGLSKRTLLLGLGG